MAVLLGRYLHCMKYKNILEAKYCGGMDRWTDIYKNKQERLKTVTEDNLKKKKKV